MNDIEQLAERLTEFAKQTEKALNNSGYSVQEFNITVGNTKGIFRYNLNCIDAATGFQHGYADELEKALMNLRKMLTPRGELAKKKRETAARLLAEAEKEEQGYGVEA